MKTIKLYLKKFLKFLLHDLIAIISSVIIFSIVMILLNVLIGFFLKGLYDRNAIEIIIRSIGTTVVYIIIKCLIFEDIIEKTDVLEETSFISYVVIDLIVQTLICFISFSLVMKYQIIEIGIIRYLMLGISYLYEPYALLSLFIDNFMVYSIIIMIIIVTIIEIFYYRFKNYIYSK